MMGRRSFKIRTARQFLEGLVEPDYDEFLQEPSSSRLAIHCALECWHLIEWVWADVLKGNTFRCSAIHSSIRERDYNSFLAYAVKTCPELGIVRDIATGSKHSAAQSSCVKDSNVAGAFQADAFQSDTFDIARLEVELASSTRHFADCLEAAVTFCRAFFRNHVP